MNNVIRIWASLRLAKNFQKTLVIFQGPDNLTYILDDPSVNSFGWRRAKMAIKLNDSVSAAKCFT